ncbi:LON peptidase substrate-binding domain-containing protein [Escherichia coli]
MASIPECWSCLTALSKCWSRGYSAPCALSTMANTFLRRRSIWSRRPLMSEQEVLVRTAISQFEGYIKLNKKTPREVLTSLNSIDDPARLADTIAAHMPLKLADKRSVLDVDVTNVWNI